MVRDTLPESNCTENSEQHANANAQQVIIGRYSLLFIIIKSINNN